MLWEPRGLYAPTGSTADPWLDHWRMARWETGSAADILKAWRKEGYTHILLYRSGEDMVRSSPSQLKAGDWQALDDLLASLPSPVSFDNVYLLYPINTAEQP